MCLLGVCVTTYNFKRFNPQNPPKWAWLCIFHPNWQVIKSQYPAGKIRSKPNSQRVIELHIWIRRWSKMAKFQYKMANGRHIAKFWKRYNSPTNGPIWMKLGWSHPIVSPTCAPWCGFHGNGRCIATAHWTFSRYWRLEAERVKQFWWNLVQNSKWGPQNRFLGIGRYC